MNNKPRSSTLLALLSGMLIAATAAASTPDELPDILGEARDPGSGQTLYFEHHYCDDDLLACSVFYLDTEGQLMASKTMDYSFSRLAPSLHFVEYRFDKELSYTPSDPDLVVDSGFDNFVRSRWDSLDEGEAVRFPMKLLGRDKPLKMKGSKASGMDCSTTELCIDVALDSWLLGSLVDPIQLTYDRDERRLQRFRGLSNLRTDEGERQQVDIRYLYEPTSTQLISR